MNYQRKFGRQPRGYSSIFPHYSALRLAAPQLPLPPSVNWIAHAPDMLGMMLNGPDPTDPTAPELGDCPIAGAHHARQVWSLNGAGTMVTDANQYVLKDYEAFCGYVPGDASTDQGGVLQDVLTKAVNIGWSTAAGPDPLLAFYELDVRNIDDIKRAVAECGVAYIGIDIPEAWAQADPNSTWDVTDSPVEGGHCVILAGYDDEGFDVVSWGMRFRMTFAGFTQACDEAYGLVDRLWLAQGHTPAGLTFDQLVASMTAIKEIVV